MSVCTSAETRVQPETRAIGRARNQHRTRLAVEACDQGQDYDEQVLSLSHHRSGVE